MIMIGSIYNNYHMIVMILLPLMILLFQSSNYSMFAYSYVLQPAAAVHLGHDDHQVLDDVVPGGILSSSSSTANSVVLPRPNHVNTATATTDLDLLEFPLNLEYLEAEFFLWGSLGYGLDHVDPNLSMGGPPPIGARKANLDPFTRDIITQFAFQEVGHLRAIKDAVGGGFPRPLLNLSVECFGKVMNDAFGGGSKQLVPAFDPYANGLNYLIASYLVPYVGLTGYVGANPHLTDERSKRLVAGLLAVESAQDAIIRTMLYERASMKVPPYGITVAEFTIRISALRSRLGDQIAAGGSTKDEGIVVPPAMGAEGKIAGNVVAGNEYSIAYERTPEEILRIVYGGQGNERVPGGFFPMGADGRIAKTYL